MSITGKTPEWADPLVTGRNRELTHSPRRVYADAQAAREGRNSDFVMSLNGDWQFRLTGSPTDRPAGFAALTEEDRCWHTLTVPGNWQLDPAVDDQPIYTNMKYPFAKRPPAPPAINPTGWYQRRFELPATWNDRATFLLFESCDSACQVWINGEDVGYSQDSKLPHEFNISAWLRPGTNQVSVMVPRYCDGFWLEDQDYWHLSGIQRDVVLYSKPCHHLRDLIVRTRFDAAYRDATLEVYAFMNTNTDGTLDEGYRVELALFSPDGQPVALPQAQAAISLASPMRNSSPELYTAAHFCLPIKQPLPWSAETPQLYTLVLSLIAPDGLAIDFERSRVGFRQVEIRDQQLLLNGRRLIIRGVNAHEHHPAKGRALGRADMRAEIEVMKRLNFNAVRTSHYPRHPAFYELCDELGIYVVDEANLETHGIHCMITKDPLWMNACLERVQRMALRDKNHACVVIWSLGNESGHGPHHAAMAAWLRHYDPTRPIQYEGGFPGPAITDIMCPMYPQMDWVRQILSDPKEQRPLVMCEYAYSKGNALGNLDVFWEMVARYPRFQGGFVWDWRDKALVREIAGQPQWAYGNEFDGGIGPDGHNYGCMENPQMCLNGVVHPDLTPKPGAYELKHAQSPVGITAEGAPAQGRLRLHNHYLALDLSHLELAWELRMDGHPTQQGVLDTLPAIAAGGSGVVELPLQTETERSGEIHLGVFLRYREATAWCDAGHEVARQQFEWAGAGHHADAPLPCGTAATWRQDGELLLITTAAGIIRFDQKAGAICSYCANGTELLTRPLTHLFMRARTDNDYIIGTPGSYYQAWVDAGVDRLECTVLDNTISTTTAGRIWVDCTTRHQAEGKTVGLTVQSRYAIEGDGRVAIENVVTADAALPVLARVGMRAGIDASLATLRWYGRGPHENYADRKHSAHVGIYESTVAAQFEPYVDPSECGGHEDTRWLSLTSADQSGGLRIDGQPRLHFSALPYRMEALRNAGHVYELEKSADTELCLDGFHMGVGGDTGWTCNVHPEYLLPAGTYRYGFTLAPL